MDFYMKEAAHCNREDVLPVEQREALARNIAARGTGLYIDDSSLIRLAHKIRTALSQLSDCECADEDLDCLLKLGNAVEDCISAAQKLNEILQSRDMELVVAHGIGLADHVYELDDMRVDVRLRHRLAQLESLKGEEEQA